MFPISQKSRREKHVCNWAFAYWFYTNTFLGEQISRCPHLLHVGENCDVSADGEIWLWLPYALGVGPAEESSHYKSDGRKPSVEGYFLGWFLATPDFIPGANFLQMRERERVNSYLIRIAEQCMDLSIHMWFWCRSSLRELYSTACVASFGDWPRLYLFPILIVRRCNIGNKYRSAYLLTVLAIYSTHVTATGSSVLLHERKAVRWRHVMQPQHCWQIPCWVAPVRQQCSTFPLVQVYLFAVVLHIMCSEVQVSHSRIVCGCALFMHEQV